MVRIEVQNERITPETGEVELVDSSGRFLGRFSRVTEQKGWTDEEIQQAKKNAANWTGGITTEELLRRLSERGRR